MTQNNLKIVLVLLSAIILGGVYLYVYKPNKETTESLETETTSLETRYNELNEKNQHRDEYIADTTMYYEMFEKEIVNYPASLDPTLTIVFMKGIEDSFPGAFDISTVGLGEASQFYTLGGADGNYECYKASFPLSYTGTYSSIKDVIDYIQNYDYRMNVTSVSIAYDAETDVASGSINVNAYCIVGGDREPETVDFDVPTGVDNIFLGGEGAAANTNFAYNENNGEIIKTTNDIKITLNKAGNDTADGIVISAGSTNTNVTSNDNEVVKVSLDIFEEDGKNYAQYSIGDKAYTVEITGKDVKIYVESSKRVDADDKNAVKLNITNATKLSVFVKVDGEDAASPRFAIGSKTGTVKVY